MKLRLRNLIAFAPVVGAILIIVILLLFVGTNPIEAFNALETEADVFLVISDLRMPEMLGSDLLLKIKDKYTDIITILLTGYLEVDEIMKAVKSGIFAYILKPWDEKYLLTEIGKAYDLAVLREEKTKYLHMLEEELRWGGELQKKLLQRENAT